MGTLGQQRLDVGRLVDVVVALLPNLAEGLNADGEAAFGHVTSPVISRHTAIRPCGWQFCQQGLRENPDATGRPRRNIAGRILR